MGACGGGVSAGVWGLRVEFLGDGRWGRWKMGNGFRSSFLFVVISFIIYKVLRDEVGLVVITTGLEWLRFRV